MVTVKLQSNCMWKSAQSLYGFFLMRRICIEESVILCETYENDELKCI